MQPLQPPTTRMISSRAESNEESLVGGNLLVIALSLGALVVVVGLVAVYLPSQMAIALLAAQAAAALGLVAVTVVLARQTLGLKNETRHLTKATERLALFEDRAKLLAQMDMYQDIAKGNRWEWSPWDIDERDLRYHEWDQWRQRCISYYPRFYDPVMRPIYTEFADLLRKQKDGSRWRDVYPQVRQEADSRLADLRAQLGKLDKVISGE